MDFPHLFVCLPLVMFLLVKIHSIPEANLDDEAALATSKTITRWPFLRQTIADKNSYMNMFFFPVDLTGKIGS